MKRSTGVLDPKTSILFVCDMQDKFQNLIYKFNDVLEQSKAMVLVSKALDIPIIYTEQNPSRLGKTIKELRELSPESVLFEKTIYSMYIPDVVKHLNTNHKEVKSIIIVGTAAHVCVIQSAIDFAENGYDVHIILDAVSSVSKFERLYALERMKQSDGIFITTVQSIAFQLSKDAKHKSFKTISYLLKDEKPINHLLNDNPFYSKL